MPATLPAASVTLHPTGQGYSNLGTPTPTGAGTNWDRVNDQTSPTANAAAGTPATPDNSTYVTLAGNNDVDAFVLTTSGNIPAGSTVTDLTVFAVASGATATQCAFQVFYRVNGTNTTSADFPRTSTTFSLSSNAWTGLSLAEADWSTLQIGVIATDANPDVRVSQVYVTVTYSPPVMSTTVGTVTATNGAAATPSLSVSAPYTNDFDGDNSLSYRYRVSPAGAWSGTTNLTHGTSPYSFTIGSLTCGTAYDIEVTYVDSPDGVTGTNPQTVTATPTNCTLTGTATAAETTGATPSIAVSAPYTQDGNGNNTLSYRSRLSGGSYGTPTNLTHSASPYSFTLSGLTCGASYDVEVTYADANGVSGTAQQTISNVTVDNCTAAGSPSAVVNSCAQITVSAPFTYDLNTNGSTSFERGPTGTGPWTSACSGVTGSTPRTCVDTGVTASSTYYYRVTYADADGVSGTVQPVIGAYATPSCNTPPAVSITSPSNGASFGQGATVTFTGTATDAEEGNLTASLSWTSSLDGPIGSGGSFTKSNLSVGTHTITASVTDSGSLTGSAQVTITITANVPGVTVAAPTATINTCTQITVQVAFTGDSNGNSTTLFERGPSASGPWSAVTSCGTGGVVGGASPRVCVDTTVADSSVNYYRVDFTDGDGVTGTDPSAAIGPYDTTPYCGVAGTTTATPTAEGSSCSQITVFARFTGDDDGDGWAQVESSPAGQATWTVACPKATGLSPRTCIVPGLTASTAYDLRVDFSDPDGVAGTDPQTVAGVSTRACGTDGTAPTLLVLAPARDAIVSGTDRVKVQVYDAVGATSVQWSVDQNGDTGLAAATVNANYDCGAGCSVWEFDLATGALAVGNHFFTVKAADAAGNVARTIQAFKVQSLGGDGRLLRRTAGSQLCIDCHNLKTHSSQTTSDKYGNWAIGCDACHTPHKTRNLSLIREEIQTPNSGSRSVRFEARTGAVASSGTPGSASYANEDNATQTDGPCQTCHTRTENAGGQARWRNSAAGGNADQHYGNGVATSKCVGCHTHSGGFSGAGGGCNSCHNAPPTVGKHGVHDQVWDSTAGNTATSYSATAAHGSATQYGFACAKCHSGSHFSDAATPHTVEVLFDATSDPKNPSPAGYVADGGSRATDPGVSGEGWYWSNGTCSNVYCHSDADRIGGISYKIVTWNQSSAWSCTSCHDAGGAATTLSAAHDKHTDAAKYSFGCVRCHAATVNTGVNVIAPLAVSDKTQHVDGVRTLAFDASGPDNSGGSYSQDPGYTCSNTYCHSNGQDKTAPFTSGPSIAWSSSAALDCTSCHAGNATAAATMSSGRHTAHVNNLTASGGVLGVNYECAACHASTVTAGDDRAITGWTAHVNGAADVAGALTDATYVSPTCNNAYCHSSGQATPEYYAPSWTTGSLDCKGCHGNAASPAFTSQFGEPNYASGSAGSTTANSHRKHVSSAADCAICHQNTTVNGTALKAGSTLHTDQSREVTWDSVRTTAGATYTPGGGTPKSCGGTGSACHASGTPQWGGTVYCINCHGAAADSANWNINDGVMSQINTTEWAYSGHGKASGQYDGTLNTAANFGAGGANPCLYCHDDAVNHKVTSNPFRLRSTGNQVCFNCHATGSIGVTPTGYTTINGASKVNANHWADKHGGDATKGGYFCWDCHDPHGDRVAGSGNIAMIGASVAKASDGLYGVPATTVAPIFTARSTGTDFAKSATPWNGICNVCHTTTNHYTSAAGDGHNSTLTCTQSGCHTHDQGTNKAFYAGESNGNDDCRACHTMGMVISEASRTSTYHHVMETANNTSGGLTVYPTSPTPTSATANLDKSCTQCHADHNVFRPDINTGNTGGRAANLRSRIANGPPTAADGVNQNAAPGDTAGSYFGNTDANAAWTNGGICLSCHTTAQTKNTTDQKTYTGDPGSTTAVVSATANFGASAHGFAAGGQFTKDGSAFSVACAKCHGETTTSYQNGTLKFDMHTSANRRMLQTMGITTPTDPLEENFCWRCHSRTTDTTPGGGPAKTVANKDYYNVATMSGQSELVFTQFTNTGSYPWDHPVQGAGGLHDPVEGNAANDGTIGGSQRHIQCEDCHNPHASAPIASGIYAGSITSYTAGTPDTLTDNTKSWTVNSLKGFTVKMVSSASASPKYSTIFANTATTLSVDFVAVPAVNDKYIIVNWGVTSTNATWTGNRVSPAMRDVWGVNPTFPSQPAPPNWNDSAGTATAAEIATQYNAIATWNRTSVATVQGQICIKCHSTYAYGASPPNTPSGAGSSSTTTWVNTAGATTAQSDIASQFNPNNLSHHAVFARGNNQPIKSGVASYYNPSWPKFISGTGITVSTSGTTVTLTGSTWPVTLLPGWFINIGSAAPAQGATTWYEVTAVTSTTQLTVDRSAGSLSGQTFMLTAGLGNNFVPPWGPWSTLSCSDCHTSSVQSDPFGPHGSAVKWLLRGGEPQGFTFYNGTASTPTNIVTVTYTPDTYNLCLNCHRRDVYGDFVASGYTAALNPNISYARQNHPIDAGKNHSLDYRSSWGIPCMNCHGGARIGQIHGSNLGKGSGGTGGSYSGRRLLAGSSWYAVTRSGTAAAGTCWTKGGTDAVDTCGHSHGGVAFLSGTSGRANYDYESGAN